MIQSKTTGVVSGAITGAGTVNFAGVYTANAAITANTTNLNSGSISLAGALTTSALTTTTGTTLNTNQYKVVTTGAVALNGTALWQVDINGTTTAGTDYGQITNTGSSVTIADAATFTITPTVSNALDAGTSLTLIDTDEAADLILTSGAVSDITVTDNSKVMDYALSSSAGDLIITFNSASAASMGINARHVAVVNRTFGALSDGADDTAWDAFTGLTTSTATENAAEQLQPNAATSIGAALASVNGVSKVITARQTNTRIAFNSTNSKSGISTGDVSDDLTVWAQVFGSNATQDKVDTIDGYDSDSLGIALGWEVDKLRDQYGLSLSYSDANVDGKSASASHTDTTAGQVSVYGTYDKATDWMIGYAKGNNDTKRTINFGGLNRTAKGSYDSSVTMAKVGHSFASSEVDSWIMTPKADLSWTNISNNGYTETGASNLNLIVNSSDEDIVTARVGGEFTKRFKENDAVTIPYINVMFGHDIKNNGAETTSTFTGGGSAFTTKGADPEKTSLQLGFGVDHVSDDSTVSFDLNADLRSDYDSMSGSLTFKSKF